MNTLKKWLLKQLSRQAKPYMEAFGLLKTVKNFHRSAIVWEPKGKRIVVLAPHMDDEVIGCGGTLYRHVRKGAEVSIVYMTDGRYGRTDPPNLTEEEKRRREVEMVEIRKAEARRAVKILGVKEGIFLDVEDGQLASTNEIQKKLRRIFDSIQPDLIYLPFFLEEHPDHRAVSPILLDATEGARFRFDCVGYEVWTPLFPNCFVDISDTIEIKKQALRQYQSQLDEKDYIHTALGLNAYRSIALLWSTNRHYVEAFYMAPLEEYRKLYRSYCK